MTHAKIKPEEIQQIGLRIDNIYNAKNISQHYVIMDTEEGRTLFLMNAPPKEEQTVNNGRQAPSDTI